MGHVDLTDRFGRVIRDLRISVTDRCNFRCTYCMEEEMTWLPRSEVLTFEEIERIARLMVERYGIEIDPPHRRRADGSGQPRRRSSSKLAALETDAGPIDVAMTTNGATLRASSPARSGAPGCAASTSASTRSIASGSTR